MGNQNRPAARNTKAKTVPSSCCRQWPTNTQNPTSYVGHATEWKWNSKGMYVTKILWITELDTLWQKPFPLFSPLWSLPIRSRFSTEGRSDTGFAEKSSNQIEVRDEVFQKKEEGNIWPYFHWNNIFTLVLSGFTIGTRLNTKREDTTLTSFLLRSFQLELTIHTDIH